ncbi:MAG: hypothetical protein CVT92_15675 [Bacteroidetes bacterium HGW-Bacteroidetes-1]|nr:MAG: hypothetical protein CVT92_15675 [Bacteroidetes bacterium HGW-Bacteroidetes-1]
MGLIFFFNNKKIQWSNKVQKGKLEYQKTKTVSLPIVPLPNNLDMPLRKWFSIIVMITPFILIPVLSNADNPQIIDSLKIMVEKSNGKQKLIAYQQLIKSLRNIDPAKGITYSKPALKLADSLNEPLLKARILNEEGVIYRKLNIPEMALQLHLESLHIFESNNDSIGVAYTLANIGNVYHVFGEYEKALDFHFRSLFLKEYLKDEPQIAYSQNAIGMVLVDLGEYARALDFYISAMAIRKKHDQKLDLANVYANIGKVMVKLLRYEEAMDFLNNALKVYEDTQNIFGESLVLNQMAELYFIQGEYTSALSNLDKAEKIALAQNNISVLHYNYMLQKEIFKNQKRFEEALIFSEKASVYKDSLFTERRNYEMTELQIRYETKRLDAENEILKHKVKEQDFRIKYIKAGAFSILLVITIAFLIWLYLKGKKTTKALENLNLTLEQRVNDRTRELQEQIVVNENAFNSLKQSEERFRAISKTSPFGIAGTDLHGNIVFFNQRLSEGSHIDADSFTSGKWMQYIMHEDRNDVEQLWESAHKFQKDLPDIVFRIREKNTIRWMHIKGAPMTDDNGFIGLVIVMENITETKTFEQDLIKAKNKAEESDRLKSAFLANMSHEIRTPMNAILGFSDLLASEDYSEEEKVEFVQMIRSSGMLLLNLINDIIDISKIEAGELKIQKSAFKIAPLMDDLYQTFRQQLDQNGKKDIKLILSHRDEFADAKITSDKLRLQQILTNLLSNAIKFTEKGQIEFGIIKLSNKFEIFVKDSGIGIPESKLEVIFERFRQADDSHTRLYGGTGLGLAITKNLTFLLGGEIWVESVDSKGTAFYLTLPATEFNHNNQEQYPDYSNKTILVAEDVDTNFQLMFTMLRKSNANVIHAKNGMIAVDMVLESQPDIVLMDIQMPDMDGKEALRQMRKNKYKKPVVAITAFALAGEEKSYLDFGFDSYMSKPLGIEKVYTMLSLFFNSH